MPDRGAVPGRGRGREAGDIAVIVHPDVRVSALDQANLEAIFTTRRRFWHGSKRIASFNLPPRHPTRAAFDRAVLGRDPDEVGRFWVDRRIRGGARPPRSVSDPRLMVRVVSRVPGSIGYVPARYVDDTVRVVAVVRHRRVLAAAGD
jgi:ABC-type phosphate transport system substrate-binding protein